MSKITVSEVKFRLNDVPGDELVGWASCLLSGAVYLNNIMVKAGRSGLYLHFPRVSGKPHFFFNPITAEALQVFEEAIIPVVATEKEAAHEARQQAEKDNG